jgi:hypothetical protein
MEAAGSNGVGSRTGASNRGARPLLAGFVALGR